MTARTPIEGDVESLGDRLVRVLFGVYKAVVSPVLHAVSPSRCIYLPTCSEYAYTAVSRFGVVRGGWLAMRRLARCGRWSEGGLDPVPELAGTRLAGEGDADHLP